MRGCTCSPCHSTPRVIIDDTIATRDLVFALNRSPRSWVLLLSEQPTRLFVGVRETLVEVRGGGTVEIDIEGTGLRIRPVAGDELSEEGDLLVIPRTGVSIDDTSARASPMTALDAAFARLGIRGACGRPFGPRQVASSVLQRCRRCILLTYASHAGLHHR